MKRIISFVLCLSMLVSMLPAGAFAAEVEETTAVTEAVAEAAETLATEAPVEETTGAEEPEPTTGSTEAPEETTEAALETEAAETVPEGSAEAAAETEGEEPEEPVEETLEFSLIPDVDLPEDEELFALYVDSIFYGGTATLGTAAGDRLTGDAAMVYEAMVPMIRQIAAGELDSSVLTVSGGFTEVGDASAIAKNIMTQVFYALMADMPYEMYWFDKTVGVGGSLGYTGSTGNQTLTAIQIGFAVSADYSATGAAQTYDLDTAKTGAASAAAENAAAIVEEYADLGDYEKLEAYKTRICSMVSYNDAAAKPSYDGGYGDPWQLIWVFDGDVSTKVVCEGYSKAFQYLCDLSDFDADITCYSVQGYMDGGGHMWNIVSINGSSYLADITNSDSGTVGAAGGLFLVGGAGDAVSGYTFKSELFTYNDATMDQWGTGADSILTLAEANFDPDSLNVSAPDASTGPAAMTGAELLEAMASAQGQYVPEGPVVIDSEITLPDDVMLNIYAPATLTVTGTGRLNVTGGLGVANDGIMTVEEGGYVYVTGSMAMGTGGAVTVAGTLENTNRINVGYGSLTVTDTGTYIRGVSEWGMDAVISVETADGITGIDRSLIDLETSVSDQAGLESALVPQEGYAAQTVYLIGLDADWDGFADAPVELSGTVTIPEGIKVQVGRYNDQTDTTVLTEGAELIVEGQLILALYQNELIIEEGAKLTVAEGGYMSNFSQITLAGTLENNATIQQSELLTLEETGVFLNNGTLYLAGTIVNNGTYAEGGYLEYWDGGSFEGSDPVSGVIGTVTWDEDNHVGDKVIIPQGSELIIPEGTTIYIYADMDVRGKLTVEGTLKVYHPGSLSINGGTVEIAEGGSIFNGGSTFVNAGELIVDGDMWGYNPVVVDGTVSGSALGRYQDELERGLAEAAANGYPYYLMQSHIYILERDLTVDCELYLNSKLLVPEGVTLTNNGTIVCQYGGLDIQGSYVAGENARVCVCYWGVDGGIWIEIPGIPNDQIVALYKTTWGWEDDEADLHGFYGLTGYAAYEAYVDDEESALTLTQDLTVPAGKSLVITGSLVVPAGCTLQVQGDLIIAEGGSLTVETGAAIVNSGSIVNNGTYYLQGTASGSGSYTGSDPIEVELLAQEEFLAELEAAEGFYELTKAVIIESDFQIPADLFVYFYGPASITVTGGELYVPGSSTLGVSAGGRLTVEEGASLCVEGKLSIGEGGKVTVNGAVYNYGTVEVAGTFWVNGWFSDNGGYVDVLETGVAVLDAMDRFEAALNAGGEVRWYESITLTEDLTIDQGEEVHVLLHENASLIVPDGLTLTVDSPMVLLGGSIVVEDGGSLILNDRIVAETEASSLWTGSDSQVTVNDTGTLIINNGCSEINGGLLVRDGVETLEISGAVHVGMGGTGELAVNGTMEVYGYVCIHPTGTLYADGELYIYNNEDGCGYLDVYGAAYLGGQVSLDGLMSAGSELVASGYEEGAGRIEVNCTLYAGDTSGIFVNRGGSFQVNDVMDTCGQLSVSDGGVLWVDGYLTTQTPFASDGDIRVGYFEMGELTVNGGLTNNGYLEVGANSSVILNSDVTNNHVMKVAGGCIDVYDSTLDNFGSIRVEENCNFNLFEGAELNIHATEEKQGELDAAGYVGLSGTVNLYGVINVGNDNAENAFAENAACVWMSGTQMNAAEGSQIFVNHGGRFVLESESALTASGLLRVNQGGAAELLGNATFSAPAHVLCFGELRTEGTTSITTTVDIPGGYAELSGDVYLGEGGSLWVVEGGRAQTYGTVRVLENAAIHVVDGELYQSGPLYVSGYLAVHENGSLISDYALNILNDENGCGYLDNAGHVSINAELYLDGLFTTGAAKDEEGNVAGPRASADVSGTIYGGASGYLGVLTDGDVNITGNLQTTGEVRTESQGTLWVEGDVYLNGRTTLEPNSALHVNYFGSGTDPETPEEMLGDGMAWLYVGGQLTNYGYLSVNPDGELYVTEGGVLTIDKQEAGAGYLNNFGAVTIQDGGLINNYSLMDVSGSSWEKWASLNINQGGCLYVEDNLVMAVMGYGSLNLEGSLIMTTGSYMEIRGDVTGYEAGSSWTNNGTIHVGVDRDKDDYTGYVYYYGTYRPGEDSRIEVELYDTGYYSYPLNFTVLDAEGYVMDLPIHLYAIDPSDLVQTMNCAGRYETLTVELTQSGYELCTGDEANVELVIPENATIRVLTDAVIPYGYEVDALGEIFVGTEAWGEEEPAAAALDINGGLSLHHPGSLTVYNGSSVNVSGTIHNGTAVTVDGILTIPGKWIGYAPVVLENGEVSGDGMPSPQDVFESMIKSAAAVGYPAHLTEDLELERDVTVSCTLVIEEGVTLTVPKGVTVSAYGPLQVYGALNIQGTLKLYHPGGTLTVFEGGTVTVDGTLDNGTSTTVHGALVINGTWEGYIPVSAGSGTITGAGVPVQEIFEAMLKAAEAGGYPARLTSDLKLKDSVEINCPLIIDEGVTLTVPKGVTVTLGQTGVIDVYGTLTVSSGAKLINNGELFANIGGKISCSSSTYSGEGAVGTAYDNGTLATVSGIAKTKQRLYAQNVAEEAALISALDYIRTNKYLEGMILPGEELVLTGELEIPENVYILAGSGVFLISEEATLVNNGIIRLGPGAVMPVGGDLDNYGTITVHEEGQLVLNTDLDNYGTLTVEGTLVQNGSLFNYGGNLEILDTASLSIGGEAVAYNYMAEGTFGSVVNYPAESLFLIAEPSSQDDIRTLQAEHETGLYNLASIQVNSDLTIDSDLHLTAGVALLVGNGAVLTIDRNVFLTVDPDVIVQFFSDGRLVNNGFIHHEGFLSAYGGGVLENNGDLTVLGTVYVDADASFINDSWLGIESYGIVEIAQDCYSGQGEVVSIYVNEDDQATVTGIPTELQTLLCIDCTTEQDIHDLYDAKTGSYGRVNVTLRSDLELTQDLYIPENGVLRVYSTPEEDPGFTLVIPEDVTVTNYGVVRVFEHSVLVIDGHWVGNQPIADGVDTMGTITGSNVPMSMEDFLVLLQEENPVLNAVVTLTGDVTVDKFFVDDVVRYFTIGQYGTLIVPEGVTLTVRGYLDVEGTLIVQEGGRLVNEFEIAADTGYISLAEGSYTAGEDCYLVAGYADGQLGIIEGIDLSEVALAAYTCTSEEDIREVVDTMAADYQMVIMKIRSDITIETDLYIPENVLIRILPVELSPEEGIFYPTFTVSEGATVFNDGTVQVMESARLTVDGSWEGNLPESYDEGIIGGEFFEMDSAEVMAMIENGETWISVLGTLTVDEDLVIPFDVILCAEGQGKIIVNENARLIVDGELIGTGNSTITVKGLLVNGNYIRVESYARLDVEEGGYVEDDACNLQEVHAFDEHAWISGISGEYMDVIINGCSEDEIRGVMDHAASIGARYLEINIYDELTLTGGLTVPENALLTIENWNGGQASLIVPQGVTLNNLGRIRIAQNGTLTLEGKLLGNLPVIDHPTARFIISGTVSFTQNDLEAMLARAAENGETVNLSVPLTLTKDLVIPENAGLYITGSGAITVPAGRTLTVNGWVDVAYGGTIVNSTGGVVKNNGSITAIQEGVIDLSAGAYDPAEWAQLRLVWLNEGTENITHAQIIGNVKAHTTYVLQGWNGTELGYFTDLAEGAKSVEIYIDGPMVLNRDITLPENTRLLLENVGHDTASLTVPSGFTLTNNGHIQIGHDGHVIVSRGGALEGNQPIVFVSTGSYVNDNFTEADLRAYIDRKAAEGTYEMPAEVFLSSDITLSSDLDIPWGVNLVISKDGALRVPDGVTLNIFGKITTQMGTGLFIEGGTVETVWYNEMDGTAKLGIIENIHGGVTELTSGEYINNGFLYEIYNGNDLGYFFNEETGEMENAADASFVRGIPLEDRIMVARGTDENNIRMVLALAEALAEEDEYGDPVYPDVELWITDGCLYLDRDLEIPAYASMTIDNQRQYGGNVTVPEGITLTNYGSIHIGDEGSMDVLNGGTLDNRGSLSLSGSGTLHIYEGGAHLGGHPVYNMDDCSGIYINDNGFTQADLEAMIESAQDSGYPRVNLGTSVTLTGDLVIPEGILLQITGADTNLFIPAGTTLINNGEIDIRSGGGILGEGGHLQNNGEIHVYFMGGRLDMTNGTDSAAPGCRITAHFIHNTGLMRGDCYVTGITPGNLVVEVQGSETEIFRTAAAEAERIWHEGGFNGEPEVIGSIWGDMTLEDELYWPIFNGTPATLTVQEYSTLRIPAGATLNMFGELIVKGTLIVEEGAYINAAYPVRIEETGQLILPEGCEFLHYRPGVELEDYEVVRYSDRTPVGEPQYVCAEAWTPADADIYQFRYTIVSGNGGIFGAYDSMGNPLLTARANAGAAIPVTAYEPGIITVEVVPITRDEDGTQHLKTSMAKTIDLEFVTDAIAVMEKDAPDFLSDGWAPGLWAGGKMAWTLSVVDAMTYDTAADLDLNSFRVDYDPELADFAKVTLSRGTLTVTALSTVTEERYFDITVFYNDLVPVTQTIVLRPKLTATGIYLNGEDVTGQTLLADLNRGDTQFWLDFLVEPYSAYPNNEFNYAGERIATWTSSSEAIATVDDYGCVTFTGEKTGKVKITVTVNAGTKKTASVTFNVAALPQYIESDPANESYLTLIGGSSAAYTVIDEYGETLKSSAVKWFLSDEYGAPLDSHPYASVTAAGKLTTKAVADETKVYLMAQVIGDAYSAMLYEPVCVTLYPALTSVKILDAAGGDATGKTLLYDFIEFADYRNEDGTWYYPLGWDADPYLEGVKEVTWKSSRPAVADIDADGTITVYTAGTAKFTMTAVSLNNKKLTATLTMNFGTFTNYLDLSAVDASGNVLDLEDLTIYCNEKITFSGDCLHIDAYGQLHEVTTDGITWSVEDKATGSVSTKGVLSAKAVNNPGRLVVVATSKDGFTVARIPVTVLPKQVKVGTAMMDALSIYTYNDAGEEEYLTKATKTIQVGDSLQLYMYNDEDVTWTSKTASTATVDENGLVTVTATKNGASTVITATANDGSKRTATFTLKVNKLSCDVTVTTKKTDIPTLDGYPMVASGKTLDLVGTVYYPDGSTDTKVNWTLAEGDEAYATISTSGKITAAKNLTESALISVRATAKDGVAWSVDYPVWIMPLSTAVEIYGPFGSDGRAVDVTNTTVTWDMRNGRFLDLNANLFPMTAYQKADWKSSSAKVATITADGEIECLTSGTTTITATAADGSGKKATFKLTVVKTMEPGSLTLPESAIIGGGKSLTLTKLEGYGIDTEATNQTLTWTMTDADGNAVPKTVATLSAKGVLATKAVTEPIDLFIRAESTDGSGEWAECTVTVYPVIKGVKLYSSVKADITSKTVSTPINIGYGILPDATNVAGFGYDDDRTADEYLGAEAWDITYAKEGLVEAGFDGQRIIFSATEAAKPGDSVKITLKAKDGSSKTAYFTLQFTEYNDIVPLSVVAAEYGNQTAQWWAGFEGDFEAAYPGIDLQVDVLSWWSEEEGGDIYSIVTDRIESGDAPDILNLDTYEEYAASGLLLPVEDYMSGETYGKFFDAYLEQSRMNGTVWAVPDLASGRALYYNWDVLAEAGLEIPSTFEELIQACEVLRQTHPDMIPFGVEMSDTDGQATFAYFTLNNGGGFVDADGNWALNSEANVEAITAAIGMVNAGLTNDDPAHQDRYELQERFAMGEIAMTVGPNQIGDVCDAYGLVNYAVAPIPTNTGDLATLGVMDRFMCFDNDYTQQELAAVTAFFDFFYEDQRYAEWTQMEGFLPATSTGCDALTELDSRQYMWKYILDASSFYPAAWDKWADVRNGVIQVMQEALLGGDVRELLDALQARITGQQTTDITLWTYPVGAWGNIDAVAELAAAFNAETGIGIEVVCMDYSNGDQMVETAIASGEAPDLILEGPERLVSNWGRRGLMVDLSDMLAENQSIYSGVRAACYDGAAAYEYPLAMTVHSMAINKTVFEAANAMQYIDEETHTWTTENFFRAVQAVYEYTGREVAAVYCGSQGGDQGTRALVNNLYGGTYTNAGHTAYTWNTQENIEALLALYDCNGIAFDPSIMGGDEIALFRNGVLQMSFCWNIAQQKTSTTNSGDEIMFLSFPAPQGTDAQLQGGVWGFGIFDNGDDARIEAARAFIRYVCDSEATAQAVSTSGYFPVRADVTGWTQDELMLEYNGIMSLLGDYYQVADNWSEARTAWWNMLQEVSASDGSEEMITEITTRYTAQANGG